MSLARPIELQAPDLSRWRAGNSGVEFVWSFDSGRPGAHVMVQALTHGNELCGAIALDWLLGEQARWRPLRGRLTLSFGNIAAFARWDPADPDRSRFVDEDFNRVWADEVLLGARDSVELRRARELLPFVDSADLLLDMHSMHEPCKPIMVCGTTGRGGAKGAALARELQVPEMLLIDTGHPAGLRLIERGPFGDPQHARTAVLIECGQHWEAAAAEVACDTLLRFLRFAGVLDAAFVDAELARLARTPPPSQTLVRVSEAVVARSENFQFVRDFCGLQVIAKAGDPIAHDGAHTVRAPYDDTVLVMPSMSHRKVGTTMVRLGRIEALPSA
jgi:predicted deacylase